MRNPFDIFNRWWNVMMGDSSSVIVLNSPLGNVSVAIGSLVNSDFRVERIYNGVQLVDYLTADGTSKNIQHDPNTIITLSGEDITSVGLWSNQISTLSVSGSMTLLDCNNNNISALDVRWCDNLTYLKVGANDFLNAEETAIAFANSLCAFASGTHNLIINGGSSYLSQITAIATSKGWTVTNA